jgi:thioredoxin 1|tara:strand:- start:696 stop:956 length:261 start_codon:yes stop_codon:yes gene_type:complete
MIKVIKFYANWCGPCKVYAKSFDKVAEELKDTYEFVNVNIEEDTTGLAAQYKVNGIPTTVVIDGEKVKSETGRMDEKRLKAFIGSE